MAACQTKQTFGRSNFDGAALGFVSAVCHPASWWQRRNVGVKFIPAACCFQLREEFLIDKHEGLLCIAPMEADAYSGRHRYPRFQPDAETRRTSLRQMTVWTPPRPE